MLGPGEGTSQEDEARKFIENAFLWDDVAGEKHPMKQPNLSLHAACVLARIARRGAAVMSGGNRLVVLGFGRMPDVFAQVGFEPEWLVCPDLVTFVAQRTDAGKMPKVTRAGNLRQEQSTHEGENLFELRITDVPGHVGAVEVWVLILPHFGAAGNAGNERNLPLSAAAVQRVLRGEFDLEPITVRAPDQRWFDIEEQLDVEDDPTRAVERAATRLKLIGDLSEQVRLNFQLPAEARGAYAPPAPVVQIDARWVDDGDGPRRWFVDGPVCRTTAAPVEAPAAVFGDLDSADIRARLQNCAPANRGELRRCLICGRVARAAADAMDVVESVSASSFQKRGPPICKDCRTSFLKHKRTEGIVKWCSNGNHFKDLEFFKETDFGWAGKCRPCLEKLAEAKRKKSPKKPQPGAKTAEGAKSPGATPESKRRRGARGGGKGKKAGK